MTTLSLLDIDIDINNAHKQWLVEIFKRVEDVLNSSAYTHDEKIDAIKWLIKQARLGSDD